MRSYPLTSNYTLYEDGRIISTHRKPRRVYPRIANNGYSRVALRHEHKYHSYFMHNLLAIAFIPKPFGKNQINHIDGNKLNNSLDNLEWCTPSENQLHAFRTGLKDIVNRRRIINIEKNIVYDSVTSAAQSIEVTVSAINNAMKRNGTSGGYHWEYA